MTDIVCLTLKLSVLESDTRKKLNPWILFPWGRSTICFLILTYCSGIPEAGDRLCIEKFRWFTFPYQCFHTITVPLQLCCHRHSNLGSHFYHKYQSTNSPWFRPRFDKSSDRLGQVSFWGSKKEKHNCCKFVELQQHCKKPKFRF